MDRLIDFTLDLRAPDGTPLANSSVWARLRTPDFGEQRTFNARTNDKGELPIQGVKPGVYALYLRAPDSFAMLDDLAVIEQQMPVRPVPLQKGGALKITVVDSLGQTLGGASLSLLPATIEESRRLLGANSGPDEDFALLAAANNRSSLASRDGDGTIELDGVPPGVYAPQLSLPGYDFQLQPMTIAADKAVELRAEAPSRRARTLNLRLVTPDGKPYAAGEVSLRILPIAANGQLGGDPPPNPDDADDLPFFPSGVGGRRVLPDAQAAFRCIRSKPGATAFSRRRECASWGQNPLAATPVDVTISATAATATVIVPGR